jgi:hypothetical protein
MTIKGINGIDHERIRRIMPLRGDLWHHRGMPKPKLSPKRNPNNSDGTRGIVGAAEQDVELTIEQAEDAAKHAIHAAVSALGLGRKDKSAPKPPAKTSTVAATPSAKKRTVAPMASIKVTTKPSTNKGSAAKPAPSRARIKPKS